MCFFLFPLIEQGDEKWKNGDFTSTKLGGTGMVRKHAQRTMMHHETLT